MADEADNARELESLLERASYELTGARSAGLAKLDDLRSSLKRVRDLMFEADALASSVRAGRREEES